VDGHGHASTSMGGTAIMTEPSVPDDEQRVRALDRAWNEVYLLNDRSAFEAILADDFVATLSDARTASKADMMRPTPEGAVVSFSEMTLRMFAPTGISYGRVRIQHANGLVDQPYVRIYTKRGGTWQATAVFVFPVYMGASQWR
jgi:hypothetical protein